MFGFVTQHQFLQTVFIVPIVLLICACAATRYSIHPGALNGIDSATYDALLIAESTIDQARSDIRAGQLPDSANAALTKLVAAYNLARESWLTYRGAITTNVPAETYLDQLNGNLTALTSAIKALQEAK